MGKFCARCGTEMKENATFCTNCGSSNDGAAYSAVSNSENAHNGMATAGFILAFFVPILGLIFSIIGCAKAGRYNGNGRGLAIAGIIISVVSWFIHFVIILSLYSELISSIY